MLKKIIGKIWRKNDNDMVGDVTQLELNKNKCYN